MAAAAAAFTAPAVARAESPDDPRYRAVLAEALQEFDAGNWEEAKALMAQAHELRPSARTFRAMGLCSYELRDYVSAIRELRQSLADPRRPLTPKQRTEIEEILGRAERFVARYKLHVEPDGAALRLDGNPLALDAGEELLLNPGTHRLEAEAAGYQPYALELRAAGQSTQDLDVTLLAEGGAGESEPSAPAETHAPPAATAQADQDPSRTWTWVALGATGVFAASTLAFALLGQSAYDDVDEACDVGKCTRAEIDRRIDDSSVSTYQTLTNVGLIATGAAAITTAVLFVVEGKPSEPSEPRVAIGPGGATWTARF
jgi:hypothetical protein